MRQSYMFCGNVFSPSNIHERIGMFNFDVTVDAEGDYQEKVLREAITHIREKILTTYDSGSVFEITGLFKL